jgi:small subunit ribosomal protein S9
MSTSAPTTGRRKTAVATAKLSPGNGKITVNDRKFDDYFTVVSHRIAALKPLTLTENQKKFDIEIKAHGGGLTGQAEAASMAIARALIRLDSELRPTLKKAGLLTRDSRMKERKKSGQPGARKRFQFSKR